MPPAALRVMKPLRTMCCFQQLHWESFPFFSYLFPFPCLCRVPVSLEQCAGITSSVFTPCCRCDQHRTDQSLVFQTWCVPSLSPSSIQSTSRHSGELQSGQGPSIPRHPKTPHSKRTLSISLLLQPRRGGGGCDWENWDRKREKSKGLWIKEKSSSTQRGEEKSRVRAGSCITWRSAEAPEPSLLAGTPR